MDWVGDLVFTVVVLVVALYGIHRQGKNPSVMMKGYGTPPDLELHKTDYFFQLPDSTSRPTYPEDQGPPHAIPARPARRALPAPPDAARPPQQPRP
jgi:hypothetical protein